jgi:hypothetical protein
MVALLPVVDAAQGIVPSAKIAGDHFGNELPRLADGQAGTFFEALAASTPRTGVP